MASSTREAHLADLVDKRHALEARIANLRQSLYEAEYALKLNEIAMAEYAPVHILPDDILKEIFEAAYEHTFDEDTLSCNTPDRDPLPATHVCRRWRAVALSLPTIWRCIHVHASHSLLQLWEERSAQMPLKITCRFEWQEKRFGRLRDLYLARLQSVSQRCAPRWQYLRLEMDSMQSIFDTIIRLDGAHLQLLALRYLGGDDDEEYMGGRLPSFPNLTSLAIINLPPSIISVPLPALRKLHLSWCGYLFGDDLRRISRAAPYLADMIIEGAGRCSDERLERAIFPHVRSLIFVSVFLFQEFFQLFDLPALRSLVVRNTNLMHMGNNTLYDPNEAARLLRGVTYLELHRCRIASRDPYHTELLRHAPSVTTLSLRETANADVVLRDLAAAEHAGSMLPQLQTVEVTASHETSMAIRTTAVAVSKFIEEKRRWNRALREVKVGRELGSGAEAVSGHTV